jgi:hypothetical protein
MDIIVHVEINLTDGIKVQVIEINLNLFQRIGTDLNGLVQAGTRLCSC